MQNPVHCHAIRLFPASPFGYLIQFCLIIALLASASVVQANIIPRIAAGDSHTVALKSDGSVWAWGSNDSGQLGFDPGAASTSKPARVNITGRFIAVAAGYKHSVALKSDGTVWAWGDNQYGQLGNGGAPTDSIVPVQVPGLNGVVDVVAGFGHTLVLKSDGSVWGWGNNLYGQLGNGTITDSAIPVPVGGFSSGVIAIAGSRGSHGMALKSDGSVWTWGSNSTGQIGNNYNGTYVTTPFNVIDPVVSAITVSRISASARTSLALADDGRVFAWGDNELSQCGSEFVTAVPTEITAMAGATAIAAGDFQSFAMTGSSTVLAVGANNYGQLGNYSSGTTFSPVPVMLEQGTSVFAISSGSNHTFALSTTGEFLGWGLNISGQLGTGDFGNRETPTSPRNSLIAAQVAAGYRHSVALKNNGTVSAWGLNDNGQLGNNSGNSQVPVPVTGLSGVVAVAAGYSHSVALRYDGTVWSWGANSQGQLGNSSTEGSSAPVMATALSGVTAIASSGGNHVLALKNDGTVWTWGDNASGQLGTGTAPTDSTFPVQISGLSGITDIAAGLSHSLALKNNGTVSAWGLNNHGQLGNALGNSATPVTVSGLSGAVSVTAGDSHSVVQKNDTTIWGFGLNANWQLGISSGTESSIPVQVNGFSNAIRLAAGSAHTAAIDSTGLAWGWGANDSGQIGNNATASSTLPTQTATISKATDIAAGSVHGMATLIDGTVWSWGLNDNGQLGNNSLAQALSPVKATGIVLNVHAPVTTATPAGGTYPSAQTVTLTSPGALAVYYTSDGSTPTYPATGSTLPYTGPVTVSSSATLKFFGIDIVGNIEEVKAQAYVIAVPPVTTASPAGGTYATPQTVTLTPDKAGTTYYTLDGSQPTYPAFGSTQVYTGAITISANTTLNFFTRDPGGAQEAVRSEVYIIDSLPNSWATPAGGTYADAQSVTLAADKAGAIYFTTDGSMPTYPPSVATQVYSQPITISSNTTLRFFARDTDGHQEAVHTESYIITTPPVTTASPTGGTYSSVQAVSLTANKPGTIYFTINGADPTFPPSGGTYTYVTPIIVTTSTTLKYFTRDVDGNQEAVQTQNYTMQIPPVTTADPPGGTYFSGQEVTLTPNETGNVYYTLDGSDPVYPPGGMTQTYGGPITLTGNTVIKYFARDAEGNNEAIQSQSYTILQRLTVTVTGGTGNIVHSTPAPDINCTGICMQDYESTTVVELTAVPSATDIFIGWSGACSGTGICSVTMNGAASVTATFEPKPVISVPRMIAAGLYHSLALQSNGTLQAWGINNYGQLGNGGTSNSNQPVHVDTSTGLEGVALIAAGLNHSIAVKIDGTVWGWGDNTYGQLGRAGSQFNSPAPVAGISDVAALAAGENHTLALKNDGTLWVWGRNNLGQLGTGTTADAPTPVQVTGLTGITAIAAKGNFSLALKNNGEVIAWGDNGYGQLGNGSFDSSSSPVTVQNLTGVRSIAAGYNHAVALKKDGTIMAWGENVTGGLGNGTDVTSNLPVAVSSMSTAVAISAGNRFTIALKSDGSGMSWGWNNWGQLGSGTTDDRWTPGSITGLTEKGAAIVSGSNHTMLLRNDGSIASWGSNSHGELGNGDALYLDSTVPVATFPALNLGAAAPVTSAIPPGDAYTSSQTVTLTTNEPATIYFTTDGTDPSSALTGSTQVYATPLTIASNTTLKFFAVPASAAPTETIRTESYAINPVPVTTANPPGGTYYTPQAVTLTANKPGTIYYTLDGSDPAFPVAGTTLVYSGAIAVSSNTTLKFFARDTDGNQEIVNSQQYIMNIPPVTSASPAGGVYTSQRLVSLSANEPGTVIYFTIDGSPPTYPVSGTTQIYSAPLAISTNTTIRFFGVDLDGNQETVHSETYTMIIPPVTTASPAGGSYSAVQSVTLSANEPGTVIYYTLDGSTPVFPVTGTTQVYSAPLVIGSGITTLKYFGRDIDGNAETVKTMTYSIYIPPITTAVPPGGAIPPGQTITLTSNKQGTIYYTVDGSTPTYPLSGTTQIYSAPVAIYTATTLKYFTRDTSAISESVQTQVYTISSLPYTTATPPGGSYTSIQQVTLSVNMPATIYYTLDGTTPTYNPVSGTTQIYTDPITISQNTTLNYFAVDSGNNAEGMKTQTYVVNLPIQYQLALTVEGGNGSIVRSAPAPDISCSGSCNRNYDIGTVVTLTAQFSGTDVFVGWSGACTGTDDCTVTMDAAQSVTATFTRIGAISVTPQIAAGEIHSVSLKGDGTVWAWGSNRSGQVGGNIYSSYLSPQKIATLEGITAIAAGVDYTLALRNDGTLWAWGSNAYGQLGDGTTNASNKPLLVKSLSGITAIAAGAGHVLAVRNDGTVWAWGNNILGQCGVSDTTEKIFTPVQVSGVTDAIAVAAGWEHSLALTGDSSVWAWGNNSHYQLGHTLGTVKKNTAGVVIGTPVFTPTAVSGLTGVTTIAAGGYHSVALKNDTTVWSWGYNDYGQLGNNSTTDSAVPVAAQNLSLVTAISAGANYTLARTSFSTVMFWGYDYVITQSGTQQSTPVTLGGVTNSTQIAAGYFHGLSMSSDGSLVSWGYNSAGQLGDGSTAVIPQLPATVIGLNLSATACFTRIDITCYGSVAEAYLAPPVATTATILAQNRTFKEPLSFNRDITTTLSGGYDSGFSTTIGTTDMRGPSMTVTAGAVIIGANVTLTIVD